MHRLKSKDYQKCREVKKMRRKIRLETAEPILSLIDAVAYRTIHLNREMKRSNERKKKSISNRKSTRPSKSTHAFVHRMTVISFSFYCLGKHPRHVNGWQRRSITHHFYWMCRRCRCHRHRSSWSSSFRIWPCLCLMNAPNKQKLYYWALCRLITWPMYVYVCACYSTIAAASSNASSGSSSYTAIHSIITFCFVVSYVSSFSPWSGVCACFFFSLYVEFILNIAIYGHEMFDRLLRTLTCTTPHSHILTRMHSIQHMRRPLTNADYCSSWLQAVDVCVCVHARLMYVCDCVCTPANSDGGDFIYILYIFGSVFFSKRIFFVHRSVTCRLTVEVVGIKIILFPLRIAYRIFVCSFFSIWNRSKLCIFLCYF